jgi:hypothetical protein
MRKRQGQKSKLALPYSYSSELVVQQVDGGAVSMPSLSNLQTPKDFNAKSREEHNLRRTSENLSCSSFIPFLHTLLPPVLLRPLHPHSEGPSHHEQLIGVLGLTEMLQVRT